MQSLISFVLVLAFISPCLCYNDTKTGLYNVMNYGAKGDGISDDAQIRGKVIAAEKNAWASYKYTWILISNVNGLTVDGSGGSLDGFGSSWWSCRNCPRPSDGSGYARGITFEEITLIQTRNPIIINQFYTNNGVSLKNGGVEVRGITFRGFHGTSMTGEAITLNCGPQGCFNITLDQINIASSQQGKPASCSCKNAHGTATSSVPNCPCLMP
ncbi:hypothetical protein LR48_Vigan11g154000 [Vigna angularis]|uniref:Pectate lyase superfamily protein domain-containing protein n=1 Tax=Phaseolus angularis TaxID=3914 RepID=A0A0L9VTV5_PHAAN|nr:hypothetical protein LR48_Vigan11g154000 [Vigna angularis]